MEIKTPNLDKFLNKYAGIYLLHSKNKDFKTAILALMVLVDGVNALSGEDPMLAKLLEDVEEIMSEKDV